MPLYRCTFTGVDEDTNLNYLRKLSKEYPFAEWGVLYSEDRAGKEARYPKMDFIKRFFSEMAKFENTALHVCGKEVYNLIERKTDLLSVADFYRIQLNFNHKKQPVNVKKLKNLIHHTMATDFIIQMNEANQEIAEEDFIANILFDKSGGRGVSPGEWPPYNYNKEMCGYAGGLDPDNIAEEYKKIAASAGNSYFWIDMENNVRTEDKFDLSKCEKVLKEIQDDVNSGRQEYEKYSTAIKEKLATV